MSTNAREYLLRMSSQTPSALAVNFVTNSDITNPSTMSTPLPDVGRTADGSSGATTPLATHKDTHHFNAIPAQMQKAWHNVTHSNMTAPGSSFKM
eukprot:3939809-Rhodomonas_salina.2